MAVTTKTITRKVIRRKIIRRVIKKASTQPSAAFAKKVRAVLHKNVETKEAYANINNVNFNSGINSAGDCQWLMPAISQGTADNARIGDQIRGQTLTIKGAITSSLSYTSGAASRIAVRMMVVTPKSYPQYDIAQAQSGTWMNTLLKKGGTTSAFVGNLQDLWAPINRDAITVYMDKVFYLNSPYVATSVGGLSVANSVKFFSKTFKLRNKLIKYDSSIGSGVMLTSYAPILLLGYAHLDASSPDTVSTQVYLNADTIFKYEDA